MTVQPLRFPRATPIWPSLLRCRTTHAFKQCPATISAPATRQIRPQKRRAGTAATLEACCELRSGLALLECCDAVLTVFSSSQARAAGECSCLAASARQCVKWGTAALQPAPDLTRIASPWSRQICYGMFFLGHCGSSTFQPRTLLALNADESNGTAI